MRAVLNRTDEMYAEICMAFDNIDNLSYRPDNTKCRTFAKNIIAYLNKLGWESGGHEDEFKTFLFNILNASHISLAQSEKEKFVNNLIGLMKEKYTFHVAVPIIRQSKNILILKWQNIN